MRTRILKFGGSALSGIDQIEAATQQVAAAIGAGTRPIVVVSAMSGMTNRLLSAARNLHTDPPAEELDRLLTTGELQAASLFAIALQRQGLRARSFSGKEAGIVTDDSFGHARIRHVNPGPLSAALAAGEVAVVTGFQGATADGQFTTLGRGGSDISAVALAAGLNADRVVLFRDVDGVHSADPKLLAASYRFDQRSYDAMTDLAEAGAPILHPQAIEMARANNIRIEMRGFARGAGCTVVSAESEPSSMPVWSVSLSEPLSMLTLEGLPHDLEMLARLVSLMDRKNLSVDGQLTQSGSRLISLSMLVPDIEGPRIRSQLEDYLREEKGIHYGLERRRRRVTLVGRGVGSRRVSKAVEKVAIRLGQPGATYWGAHHRAFIVPEREGRDWLASLHQALVAP